MRGLLLSLLCCWAGLAQAAIGISTSNFPDGLQSPYSGNAASKGVISFDYNAQLIGNPDSVLAARTVERNSGSTLPTCESANCTASGSSGAAPVQDAGSFPATTGYTATLDVPFNTSQSLAGNGSNQYLRINLNSQAQLTVNGGGQTFYIDQLSLSSSSVLRLSAGDYWVRSLTTGFQSQIQVQGSGLVRLFVRDDWSLASSALLNSPAINAAGTPSQLYVYSYGSLTLNNQATLSGYVYSAFSQGANRAITLDSPSYVYGALSGENIRLATNARVYYRVPSTALTCLSDDFNRGSGLGSDWVVRGSGYTPAIVGNRLRLTPANGNVSTVANLQRLLPAAGNLIQVQFRLYAYGGSGADGVAVVFSDALVTPQAGSYGGPLGYGTRGTSATPGFAGGWLGVGLDEYGNFSTEGGPGGPGRRIDSVAVRGSGSGSTGYRYIAGTGTLSPGVDVSGSTAGPGHLYRITIDGRTSGQVLLTVERDTGSGLSPLAGLNGINVRAASGQAVEPSNFFFSLTGSTGGSTNVHELDDMQLCALQINPVGQTIHHYELTHAGNALTCTPQPVTIRACLDANCSSLYTGATSVTLSPSGWVGGDTISFSGGSTQRSLSIRTPGTVTLGVGNSTPPLQAFSQTLCSSGGSPSSNCDLSFADSGFIFDVPTLLAARPQTDIVLQAVRSNPATQTCDPAFSSGTRDILFTRSYSNPSTGTLNPAVNDISIPAAGATVPLTFGSNASTLIKVQYGDAGRMTLNARYAPTSGAESGLVMAGSDIFVSKPYGLLLETDADAGCTADINCPVFPGGVRAGDSFALRIKAVAWQSDGEALTATALADNSVTPNFQLAGIALSSQVQAPAGGSHGSLGASSYSHALGSQTSVSQSISEVGVFRLTATPGASAYFGETVGASQSGLVGRFIPAYLSASGAASLTPACGGAFSYQGQPVSFLGGQEPQLTVTGYNRQSGVTGNYDRGDFWRLAEPARDAYLSVTGLASLDAAGRLAVQGTVAAAQSGADDGDGARSWRWSGEQLRYLPASPPLDEDLPFEAAVRQGFAAASLTDADGACVGSGSACQAYSFDFGGSELRLGRLSLGNAHGSELQPLSLPLRLESWQGSATGSFQLEPLDSCTAGTLGLPQLSDFSGNLGVGETTASLVDPLAGLGAVNLSAPGAGNSGSLVVSLPSLADWLWYDWRGVGREGPRGLATFGVYRGAVPLIYRRELYR